MTAISASFIGVPRSFMFRRLSAHSPRESGWRRMCCSSWQILHLFSVRVEPGPETSLSCAFASVKRRTSRSAKKLTLNQHSDPVPAVPEITERIPGRDRGLRVAAIVPGARDERGVAGLRRLRFVGEGTPGKFVAGARELGAAP